PLSRRPPGWTVILGGECGLDQLGVRLAQRIERVLQHLGRRARAGIWIACLMALRRGAGPHPTIMRMDGGVTPLTRNENENHRPPPSAFFWRNEGPLGKFKDWYRKPTPLLPRGIAGHR